MTQPTIPQNHPKAAYLAQRSEIDAAIRHVLEGGWYILGGETRAFESELAATVGCRHGVGVGNGTDALVLAFRALGIGPGKSIVTVAHTAVASVAAIEMVGATPLLVDIERYRYTMDPASLAALLERPPAGAPPIAAILPVHLYGQTADIAAITEIARRYEIPLIEDCAQAHGASFAARPAGSFGQIATFSFYPTKNLGALGDGGMVTTSDDVLAATLRAQREYGWRGRRYVSEEAGINTRLDELQAAILRVKLTRLASDNARRRAIAQRYDAALAGTAVAAPWRDPRGEPVFHQYVVRCAARDELRRRLEAAGIGTNIHYPVPVHLQPAYEGRIATGSAGLAETESAAREILSLPMFPQLSDGEVERVADALRRAAATL